MAIAFEVHLGDATVTALHYAPAERGRRTTLVLGHGAGADQRHAFMVQTATALAARGIDVVTYNFLYTERKKKTPDPRDVLEAWCRAAIAGARGLPGLEGHKLFVGGKSMGGRIASQVVAAGEGGGVAGLVFLGYPLHPPGRPEQLRSEHLPRIAAPMLFVQGSRDAFGTPEELAPILNALAPRARIYVVEGGDHSFSVAKKSGRTS